MLAIFQASDNLYIAQCGWMNTQAMQGCTLGDEHSPPKENNLSRSLSHNISPNPGPEHLFGLLRAD